MNSFFSPRRHRGTEAQGEQVFPVPLPESWRSWCLGGLCNHSSEHGMTPTSGHLSCFPELQNQQIYGMMKRYPQNQQKCYTIKARRNPGRARGDVER